MGSQATKSSASPILNSSLRNPSLERNHPSLESDHIRGTHQPRSLEEQVLCAYFVQVNNMHSNVVADFTKIGNTIGPEFQGRGEE
jgi:hypothetical protein